MRSISLQSHARWWRRVTRFLAVAALASCAGFGPGAVARADTNLSEAECAASGGGLDPSGTCRFCAGEDHGDYSDPSYWDGLDGCYGPDGVYETAGTITRVQ